MDELINRLNEVSDSYFGFVAGISTYAKKKPERMKNIMNYMNDNPQALSSDIIRFVSLQPDFHEDTVGAEKVS